VQTYQTFGRQPSNLNGNTLLNACSVLTFVVLSADIRVDWGKITFLHLHIGLSLESFYNLTLDFMCFNFLPKIYLMAISLEANVTLLGVLMRD